jgi:putative methionine-R-sulfoxide reductase with GAF domain
VFKVIDRYLQKSELTIDSQMKDMVNQHVELMRSNFFDQALKSDQELFSYPVPELGEGGSCSLFNQVADEPFDLTQIVGQPSALSRQLLQSLHNVVAYVVNKSKLDWFGIYQTVADTKQSERLVKLAYDGAISRSEYPLTEQFAQLSNNVQVGITGQSKVINNVNIYTQQGGAYYTCDPKVKSEACLPIYDGDENVIGIIDAEAFAHDFFDAHCMALLIASCMVISGLLTSI